MIRLVIYFGRMRTKGYGEKKAPKLTHPTQTFVVFIPWKVSPKKVTEKLPVQEVGNI
tara:strand:- start:1528 stop:1698 length:171 start_codon:yes stop_codon:yes gene_type:complete